MRYNWFADLYRRFRVMWYKFFYGVKIDGFTGSMLPVFGKGKFVSVEQNGPYWEITAHVDYPQAPAGKLRLIPCQFNHGFMIEQVNPDGSIGARTSCDYRTLYLIMQGKRENVG